MSVRVIQEMRSYFFHLEIHHILRSALATWHYTWTRIAPEAPLNRIRRARHSRNEGRRMCVREGPGTDRYTVQGGVGKVSH